MMLAQYNFTDPGVYAEDDNAYWDIKQGYPDLDGNGLDYILDTDDQDPDGTRMDMGAYYYHQTITSQPSGTGTEEDPYQVMILNHLLWISENSDSWDK